MQVPYSWILEWVDGPQDPQEAAEILTRQGVIVDQIHRLGEGLDGAIAARSVLVTPLTDHLKIVQVDAGSRQGTVVTGAPNIREGAIYAWAVPGSALPDGRTLDVHTFQGQASEGMLLSAKEMGIGPDEGGLLELDGVQPGQDVAQALGLPEVVFDVELTPNLAGFCQSVVGLAGELSAGLGKLPRFPEGDRDLGAGETGVRVLSPDLASIYLGAWVETQGSLQTPLWVKRRLWASGMRSISAFVDVTNYVLLERGQPLHAFDADRLRGPVQVRLAQEGEPFETLDHVRRTLSADDIVIADDRGPVALAGVMGGVSTEVHEGTRTIFLEAALFAPLAVRLTARRHALSSEAAQRFEKGVDRDRVEAALRRAMELLQAMGAGTAGVTARYRGEAEPDRVVRMRPARIRELLGVEVDDARIRAYLDLLALPSEALADGTLRVTIPHRRLDIEGEPDLAEEVARLFGMDQLPLTTLPSEQPGKRHPSDVLADEIREGLAGLGLAEHWGSSSTSREEALLFTNNPVHLTNPLSREEGVLRPSLIPGLLRAARLNASHRVLDIRLFEVGRTFLPSDGRPLETESLGLVVSGAWPHNWTLARREAGFYDLRGILEGVAERIGFKIEVVPHDEPQAFLHPGRQALVLSRGERVGWLGEIHPAVMEGSDLGRVLAAELRLDIVERNREKKEATASGRFPSVERDLAVLLPEATLYQEAVDAVRQSGCQWLKEISLFDIYRGTQVPQGRKSLAFRFIFRSDDHTLVEAEVEQDMAAVAQALSSLGGNLRS